MFRIIGTILFSVLLSYSALAEDQLIDATDPVALRDAIQEAGYQAKLDTDNQGDPMIKGRMSHSNYQMYFYGCKDHKNCGSLLIKVGYDMKQKPFAIDKMNEWNLNKRFGTAYLDKDGDPNLKMSINLWGGTTKKNFGDTILFWQEAVTDFEKQIGF